MDKRYIKITKGEIAFWKGLITKSGLSIQEFADKAEISRYTWWRITSGGKGTSVNTYRNIVLALADLPRKQK